MTRPLSKIILATFAATLIVGCSAGTPIVQEKISVVSASEDGMVLSYQTEDLRFRLITEVDGDISRSKIVRADGTVAATLEVPRDMKAYGDPRTLTIIEDAAGKAFIPDAAELRLAVEEMVSFIARSQDERRDHMQHNIEMVMHQVLLLTASEEGISFSPVCPEYLANPDSQVYHTIDDHRAQMEAMQLPKELPCSWWNPCCLHDLMCLDCGISSGNTLFCGPNCTMGGDCLGRCGGGCGDTELTEAGDR